MITSNSTAPPTTDGIQFIHDPSIDQRFVVIMQPCKSITLGCDESLQPPPPSALLVGSGETLLQYPVWHLEFGTRAVKVISSITACDALTCFASPFLLHFNFVTYITDCLSVIMSVWILLSVMFAKPRIITNLNQYRRRLIFGNRANCIYMIYALSMVLVFNALLWDAPRDSPMNYSYGLKSVGYVCKFLGILMINTTSKVTNHYTNHILIQTI